MFHLCVCVQAYIVSYGNSAWIHEIGDVFSRYNKTQPGQLGSTLDKETAIVFQELTSESVVKKSVEAAR